MQAEEDTVIQTLGGLLIAVVAGAALALLGGAWLLFK